MSCPRSIRNWNSLFPVLVGGTIVTGRRADRQGFHSQAMVADDETAYVTNVNGVVFAIELASGVERWRAPGPNDLGEPLLVEQGTLRAGQRCYDTSDGTPTGC